MVAQPNPKDKNKKIYVPQKDKNSSLTTPFQNHCLHGQGVWDYRSDVLQLAIFQLDQRARQKILNEEGPLPFLFRMRAGDAKQRYNMVLKNQNDKEALVMITPKLKEDQDAFSTAWVRLDRKYLVPSPCIVLFLPDKVKVQGFTPIALKARPGR